MTNALTIALAQGNFTVGDIAGNTNKIIGLARVAAKEGADLVIFPEMAITGYPAEDLLFKGVFQQAAMDAVREIASALKDCPTAALVGGFWAEGGVRYNSAFLIDRGEIVHRHDKHWLPNYGVFDEKRLFTKGGYPEPITWCGIKLGITVCEDLWKPGLAEALGFKGAELIVSLNASPFETGKAERRREVVEKAVRGAGVPVFYCNMVGGQDELAFDGRSFAMDKKGEVIAEAKGFEEALLVTQWEKSERGWRCKAQQLPAQLEPLAEIYAAMVLGLRDYVNKNGFKGVVIGISGGIDSGLTAAVAVDALGPERVHGIVMPSPYTSNESMEDAEALAKNLGMRTHIIPIEAGMKVFEGMLADVFEGTETDTTEENIQARIRGNLLMAYSNKLGFMLLTTGNKSEMSVGYATLYGDMCGGYSVLKDVYKTTVFDLSHWRNSVGADAVVPLGAARQMQQRAAGEFTIPLRMISKPPSAELKPDQRDDDTLPPYDVLDGILHGLIEERLGINELVDKGYDADTVERIARLMYIAEYKRRQSPPGVKITGMSFGRDRRYPITNKWTWQAN